MNKILSRLFSGPPKFKWGYQAGVAAICVVGAAVATTAISSSDQAQAASEAANAQVTAANSANQVQMAMFTQEQSDLAPYQAMGTAAGGALLNLMGISSTSPSSALNAPNSVNTSKPGTVNPNTGQMPVPGVAGRSTADKLTDPLNLFGGLAKGGPTGVKPVMVGEKGPEILHNKYGAHVIGQEGPEVIYPTVPGFVQPNPQTARTNKTARNNFMKGMRMSPGMEYTHRAFGGNVATEERVNPVFNFGAGARGRGLRANTNSANAASAPAASAPALPPNSPQQQQADTELGQGLGAGYNQQIADTAADSTLQASPQYQFALQQGILGLDTSAAANGSLLSGGHMAAILNYSQGLASQQYNNVYNQLMGVTSMGEAAGAGTASNALYTGMGQSGNIMNAGEGAAQADYYTGNAKAQGIQNIDQGFGSAFGMGGYY